MSQNKEFVSDGQDLPSYDSMLYRICHEEGIKLSFLCNNWVKQLQKNGQTRYIVGYKFGLNTQAASLISDDKTAASEILRNADVPAVIHEVIYPFSNNALYAFGKNTPKYVYDFLARHSEGVVLKPNCGTGGRQAYRISKVEEVVPVLAEIFAGSETACMSPYYEILHEYRVIILDNEVRLAYQKTLPDKTSWKFNLQQGAISEPLPDKRREEILHLAERAIKEIGLRFGSVDIIDTKDGGLLVLEINSGVMISHYLRQHPGQYENVKEIYRDAIRKMFAG